MRLTDHVPTDHKMNAFEPYPLSSDNLIQRLRDALDAIRLLPSDLLEWLVRLLQDPLGQGGLMWC
jgi:hypothetical protein